MFVRETLRSTVGGSAASFAVFGGRVSPLAKAGGPSDPTGKADDAEVGRNWTSPTTVTQLHAAGAAPAINNYIIIVLLGPGRSRFSPFRCFLPFLAQCSGPVERRSFSSSGMFST